MYFFLRNYSIDLVPVPPYGSFGNINITNRTFIPTIHKPLFKTLEPIIKYFKGEDMDRCFEKKRSILLFSGNLFNKFLLWTFV